MKALTMLPLKISKTKKRLSDDRWLLPCVGLAVMGLFAILMCCLRTVTLSGVYGSISAEIPVMMVSPVDPALHRFDEKASASLKRTTTTVVLTADAFYFGDLKAFSEDFADIRNKFIIRHVDHEPQLQTLVSTLDKWLADRVKESDIRSDGLAVLAASGDIPMPIVIQVIAGLKKSENIKRVVLATGVL